MPDTTTILGALKLSGKTKGGWSIGVLNRELEDLPPRREVARRLERREGLTAPELSVLMSWTKIVLEDEKGGKATVTIANVGQSNGVIHVIDSVLLPQ